MLEGICVDTSCYSCSSEASSVTNCPLKRHFPANESSPFDSSDEKDQVAIDFRAVDKLVNVAGVHSLSCLETGGTDAVTRWSEQGKTDHLNTW